VSSKALLDMSRLLPVSAPGAINPRPLGQRGPRLRGQLRNDGFGRPVLRQRRRGSPRGDAGALFERLLDLFHRAQLAPHGARIRLRQRGVDRSAHGGAALVFHPHRAGHVQRRGEQQVRSQRRRQPGVTGRDIHFVRTSEKKIRVGPFDNLKNSLLRPFRKCTTRLPSLRL
jgi:hypothetical protein